MCGVSVELGLSSSATQDWRGWIFGSSCNSMFLSIIEGLLSIIIQHEVPVLYFEHRYLSMPNLQQEKQHSVQIAVYQ